VSTISDGSSFGDTAKLFEAIDENEFKTKLEETISQMQNVFSGSGEEDKDGDEDGGEDEDNTNSSMPNINLNDLPDPKNIHDHVTGMMNGKLGNLAREIAEETAAELNMDMENAGSVNDVFKKLFQNPTKLMSLVKNVGSKLDDKLKSGDMKESELLQEASDIMQKMKSMPGMGDLQAMLAKMGMGHMMPGGSNGGGKVNMNAMKANLDRNLKAAKNKERLLAKLEQKKKLQTTSVQSLGVDDKGFESLVFSKGEQVERSVKPIDSIKTIDSINTTTSSSKKKNKKKNKAIKDTNKETTVETNVE
jgi:NADP-dependent 3-hydroxy acid dehydrogenase YdfG